MRKEKRKKEEISSSKSERVSEEWSGLYK